MLMGALATFTLVALMGLVMVRDAWRGYAIDPMYPPLHAGAAVVGSGLVIAAALAGDTRLYANIGLAVVIILLGLVMGIAAKRGRRFPVRSFWRMAGSPLSAMACWPFSHCSRTRLFIDAGPPSASTRLHRP